MRTAEERRRAAEAEAQCVRELEALAQREKAAWQEVEERRTFRVERRSYVSSRAKWVQLFLSGSIRELARQTIPKLGTDAFFEIV